MLKVNAHALKLAYETRWLPDYYNEVELVFADGHGAAWAGSMLDAGMGPRITCDGWYWDLSGYAEIRGYSIFFLGARSGVAEEARANLLCHFPGLRVVDVQHGYFDQAPDSPGTLPVVEQIKLASPNILLAETGMPLQKRWLMEN